MSLGRVHSQDSFGTVDGPGIRYVVFMQGCHMRCRYCHNRDTWDLREGGELKSHGEVFQDIYKVRNFLSGGVTVTGGEPLIQAEFVADLFAECRKAGMHTCLDTNGFTKTISEPVERLLANTDLVLLDLKQIDDAMHQKLTYVTNQHPLNFARYLHKINKPVWIRYVVVEGYTVDPQYAARMAEFIAPMKNVEKVEILPYHALGVHKWDLLNDTYELESVTPPTTEQLEAIKKEFIQRGVVATY
ncbi:pyruvate formate-lyase-activating protein [Endozoicomonas euniceicola]|uniref:Pyruvate formate-lyase-activating enzyme n=1 Tax=Endozoicomonas euniceicola TaxID=1234143 RepID=A0ABY6GW55_9GAMM|nr:pyruvate formate-lyase-activating protein [Endozoicomonas euniceicola]UYM16985.1 pyruvate formate-lyase-activating protein [Endozoicomonas euniceicola]